MLVSKMCPCILKIILSLYRLVLVLYSKLGTFHSFLIFWTPKAIWVGFLFEGVGKNELWSSFQFFIAYWFIKVFCFFPLDISYIMSYFCRNSSITHGVFIYVSAILKLWGWNVSKRERLSSLILLLGHWIKQTQSILPLYLIY